MKAPGSPEVGTRWLDTSAEPPVLRRWDGEEWVGKAAPSVRALGARVLVRRDREPATYGSGLLLRPSEFRGTTPGEGVVVSLGPDVEAPGLALGERVAFRSVAGHDVLLDGVPHVFLADEDVLALLPWPEDAPAGAVPR